MEFTAGSPARYLYGIGAEISGAVIGEISGAVMGEISGAVMGEIIGEIILSRSESRECLVPANAFVIN